MRTNVPSWCDRILWKSYPETHIVCNSYGCTDDMVTSDHSPVFGTFEVGVTSQFVSKKGLPKSSEQAYIEFENIEAIVKTASRTKFFIEFYSTCLEGEAHPHTYTHTHTRTHTHARTHLHTHTPTHTRTHLHTRGRPIMIFQRRYRYRLLEYQKKPIHINRPIFIYIFVIMTREESKSAICAM
ncbi:unnamed protein product [Oncorhynchus mykiss]|uniref:Inositol polyphosphate-related phosphatase domain-containing protein n=1 Tax=Oncorhynchus mykiss TaxID=8022 RepID=A0A060Z3E7_ONCMY|nr:unnamed protein product [Oncorhynchus mykiss]